MKIIPLAILILALGACSSFVSDLQQDESPDIYREALDLQLETGLKVYADDEEELVAILSLVKQSDCLTAILESSIVFIDASWATFDDMRLLGVDQLRPSITKDELLAYVEGSPRPDEGTQFSRQLKKLEAEFEIKTGASLQSVTNGLFIVNPEVAIDGARRLISAAEKVDFEIRKEIEAVYQRITIGEAHENSIDERGRAFIRTGWNFSEASILETLAGELPDGYREEAPFDLSPYQEMVEVFDGLAHVEFTNGRFSNLPGQRALGLEFIQNRDAILRELEAIHTNTGKPVLIRASNLYDVSMIGGSPSEKSEIGLNAKATVREMETDLNHESRFLRSLKLANRLTAEDPSERMHVSSGDEIISNLDNIHFWELLEAVTDLAAELGDSEYLSFTYGLPEQFSEGRIKRYVIDLSKPGFPGIQAILDRDESYWADKR